MNLSYIDDQSGTTLLHEAARRKDINLLQLAIRAGADVFARDRKDRPVYDASCTDDHVRVFLRQCKSLSQNPKPTWLIHFSHEPQYHSTSLLVFNSSPIHTQRLPAQIHQCREGLQYKMVRAQGRNPLM